MLFPKNKIAKLVLFLFLVGVSFSLVAAVTASKVLHRFAAPGYDPSTDTEWHGTHVAGIAAGNGFASAGLYTGVAPDAFLSIYKSNFNFDDIIAGVDKLLGQADIDNTPIAVNLSLGTSIGPHDGTSGPEAAINARATGSPGNRHLIVVAAGNEADLGEHFRVAVPTPFGTATNIRVTLNQGLFSPADIDIWADGHINVPDEHDEYTVTTTFGSESVVAPTGVTSVSTPSGLITVNNRTDTSVPNGATHISIFTSTILAGRTGTIAFTRTRNGGNGIIDGYIDSLEGQFPDYINSPSLSIIEPGNGDNVIAVGSFNVRTSWYGNTGSLSSFSSAGPTRDGRLKPDVSAPGSDIRSTRSRDPFDITSGSQPSFAPSNDNYAIMSGTSMSTPHVTGVAALVWESNPLLTSAQMRERIRRTADPMGTSPNNSWGYGKLNALRAVSEPVAAITAPARAVPGTPIVLSSSNSSGAYGRPLSYIWSLAGKPVGSATTLSGSSPSADLTPDIPGDYRVSLTVNQATPAGLPSASATTLLHVNTFPDNVLITGPATGSNISPVSFTSSGHDADGQPLSWHWVLVSRPSGSAAIITPSGNSATLNPDLIGNYTLGVRADDGLDNSVMAIRTYGLATLSGIILTSPAATSTSIRKIAPALLVSASSSGGGILQSLTSFFRPTPQRNLFIHTKTDDPGFPGQIAALGGQVVRAAPGIYAGKIPEDAISIVSGWDSVTYLEGSRRARKMLDLSRPEIFANIVQSGTGTLQPFTGKGVTVGIVDTGLTSGHPDFYINGIVPPPAPVPTIAPGSSGGGCSTSSNSGTPSDLYTVGLFAIAFVLIRATKRISRFGS